MQYGVNPLISITNKENAPQHCLEDNLIETFSRFIFLLPRYVSNLCQFDIKVASTVSYKNSNTKQEKPSLGLLARVVQETLTTL